MGRIHSRVGIQQRVLPAYRIPFFDSLAEECEQGLSIFFGSPRKDESIDAGAFPRIASFYHGRNVHLFHNLAYSCWQIGLLKWLQEWHPDVLIMEANPRNIASSAAIDWMKKRGGKIIGWGLGSPKPVGRFSALRMNLRRKFVSRFDALLTYSIQGAQEYATLGFPQEKIFAAPNAVAPKPRHPSPMRSSSYRDGRPVVLFVGRLQSRKRVDALIRACAGMLRIWQPELRIVGDGPMLSDLKALADQVYPGTKFFGAQHGVDLERHFREADLFVLPGTGGLAVQEAMSYGLPVMVGVADGTQVDLVRKKNGWMLKNDTVENLTAQLRDALSDVVQLRKMGEESYRIVSEEINLEAMVDAFTRAIHIVEAD
ncbi:MAG: glycosyltransferase family 4 protein [Chloroflexi bacterium]|nr:glycosyltransferase family 4 protein [Chloroflexota bacterium]